MSTLVQDAVDIAGSPLRLSPYEARVLVGATGVLVGLVATLDEPAYVHLSEGAGDARRATASLALPGEWYDRRDANQFAVRTVAALAASGLVLRSPGLTRTSVRTAQAILYTDLIVGLSKSVLNRARPYVGADPDPFAAEPGAFDSDHTALAMPSGHAGRVFAIASVLAHEADRWYVSIPLYAGASSVALERVRSGDHWLTDVVVGSAIGFLVGRSVSARSPRDTAPVGTRFNPILSAAHVGVALQF